jgi:hypothetical protein
LRAMRGAAMKKLTGEVLENRKRIRELLNKDDCEIPLDLAELNRLFKNIDPADLLIAQRDSLLKSGTPKEVIDDNDTTLVALLLCVNIDEWAPALFRLLSNQRRKRQKDRKRTIALDNLDEDFNKT